MGLGVIREGIPIRDEGIAPLRRMLPFNDEVAAELAIMLREWMLIIHMDSSTCAWGIGKQVMRMVDE